MNFINSRNTGRLRLRHLMETTEAVEELMCEERGRFNRLANKESAPKVFSSFNLFPTPMPIAHRVVELADIQIGHRVLEPSAGTGNLLLAIKKLCDPCSRHIHVTAVEIDGPLWHHLSDSEFAMFTTARLADFLTWEPDHRFHRVVMNPPFKNGVDIKHITKAIGLLEDGGRLVSVCANGPRQRDKLMPMAKQWIDLPDGSFKCEGTNVSTAILVVEK